MARVISQWGGQIAWTTLGWCSAVIIFIAARRRCAIHVSRISDYAEALAAQAAVPPELLRFEPWLIPIDQAVKTQTVALQEIQRQQHVVDSAVNSLEEGIACVDAMNHVVYVNQAWSVLCGAQQDIGRPYYSSLVAAEVGKMIEAVRVGESPDPLPIVVHERRLRVRALLRNDLVILVLYDRSIIERLEMRRHDFMTAISHELKTPLTSILGFADTALDTDDLDLATARDYFSRIMHHGERLSALVRDIITLSRLEEGAWPVHLAVHDVVQVAMEVMRDVGDMADRHTVKMHFDGPSSLRVATDVDLLRMILANLIGNAIRYNRPNGQAWIRVAALDDGRVRWEIEDTGIGIPPDKQERIFERFYRIDTHRSSRSGGTGLGLSIVKHILQALSGRIEVQSGAHGTRFVVWLPPVE